jgi:hypothetical protein
MPFGAGLAKKGRFHERNWLFFRSADSAVHDPAAPRDAQAETTYRRIWITKDVPVLWIDHISIKAVLLGVWQVPYGRECDPDSGEMNCWLRTNRSRGEQEGNYRL